MMCWPRNGKAASAILLTTLVALLTWSQSFARSSASPESIRVAAVVIGPQAPELELFAAGELCGYLAELFGTEVKPTRSVPASAQVIFLVGNPVTNPLIENSTFPHLTDQGIVLKSVKLGQWPAFIVGGGSPRATMWAVYALAERWGVAHLLHGDVLPPLKPFELPSFDAKEEPILRVRQWRVLNEHAMGPISWGIADYRPVIDQLAKLRFNRLLLYIWPGQPFLPLEYKGIKQTSGTLFFGSRYPITDDMAGRFLFGQEKEYWNPDLPLPGDPDKLNRAAIDHVRALMEHARKRGMECVMSASLTEFPKEFKPLLEHTHPVDMVGTPTVGPGSGADLDDPVLTGLAAAVLSTTSRTYPGLDYIALDLPEWREWANGYERAWKTLDARYGLSQTCSLDGILAAAARRPGYPGGSERALKEVKADIVALCFYDKVISGPRLEHSLPQPRPKFIISSVAEELYPILARILPAGSETLNFVDYTPSRIVKRREVLKAIPARELPAVLIYTLHDDNVGVLPQLTTHSLHELTRDIRGLGWAGFSTRYWLTGDHDTSVAYIAKAAWDNTATPEAINRDQVTRVCGEAAVPEMLKVFNEVEAATTVLEWNGLGLTFPSPSMMMQHWIPGALSPELGAVVVHYQAALEAAQRASANVRAPGKAYVNYWLGRLEFGVDYMNAIEAVRKAATAQASKDPATALTEARRALALIRQGLTAYARVAVDRSDKGAIAIMNECVCRPLQAKLASLSQQTSADTGPAVRASGFKSSKVYQSKHRPSYTSWVSFFPGERGQWYVGCEEVTSPNIPQPGASRQWIYEMSLPRGYDKSKYLTELVLLQSDDNLESWNVISREPVRASGGSFAQARTKDGRFLRFVWACYSREPGVKPSDIYYQSSNEGRTWSRMPSFVSEQFVWYPHRLRTLRDGTLVLCCPLASKWGSGTDYPVRAAIKLDTVADMQMMIFFSHDQGQTWSGPLPILSGQTVSETDFVELPDGNLLFINSSIFATPGRQVVYREGNRFTPGPLERVHSGTVPETICLTEKGVLIGCQRPGAYYWSDDLGRNWQALDGAPSTSEVYQPWIHYLGAGKVACAGHLGADDPIGSRDQCINLHTFKVEILRRTRATKLWIERAYDEAKRSFLNSYAISLTSDDAPLPDKNIEIWYVARSAPGYDSWNSKPLPERMKLGGRSISLRTGPDGKARLDLPEFDGITDIHASYQMVIRFNQDLKYPDYKPAQLPQLEFYANSGVDP